MLDRRRKSIVDVFASKAEDEVSGALQPHVLHAIAPVALGVMELVPAIELDGDPRFAGNERDVDHRALRGRDLAIELEPATRPRIARERVEQHACGTVAGPP